MAVARMYLPHDATNPLLGLYPKQSETLIRKDIGTPVLIAALFAIAKIWKQASSHH